MPEPDLAIRIRRGTTDDLDYFKEVEFQTTWENLPPEDQERFTPDQVRAALEETHEILLARPGNALFIAETEDGANAGLLWFGENRNVVTGEKDFRIPYTQGIASFTALQRRNIPSRLLVMPDENHWVLKPRNSIQWYGEVFGWLGKYLKPAN